MSTSPPDWVNEKDKTTITMKIYPSDTLNGEGFMFDEENGAYYGDIHFVVDDRNSRVNNMDKVNYLLKNLFAYVKSTGETQGNTKDINNFFISEKNPLVFESHLFNRKEELEEEGKRRKKTKATGGKKTRNFNKKTRRTRKTKK